MNCKLGQEEQLENKINKLVKFKIELIDEEITFNEERHNLQYLISLHEFLFGDVYDYAGKVREEFTEIDICEIEEVIDTLILIASNFNNELYLEMIRIIEYLKDIQIFRDGNKRTLYAFLKQLICAYRLPLELPMLNGNEIDNINEKGIKLK